MDPRNMSMGGESIDWGDPAFSTSEFQDSMVAESPWGNSALNDFTNLGDYSDSPAGGFGLRTPSKSGPDAAANTGAQPQNHGMPGAPPMSAESSSQESSSDSSSRRKRKEASESPMPYTVAQASLNNRPLKVDQATGMSDYQNMQAFEQTFNQPLPNLAVDQTMTDTNGGMFDFNSTASSPNLPRDFNQQLSLEAKMGMAKATGAPSFTQDSPAALDPAVFNLTASRDQSPTTTNNLMLSTASPNAIFSTPSSDSNEQYSGANWNSHIGQNPAWPSDFNNQFASPGIAFTPSPVANGGTPSMPSRGVLSRGRSPLHIAPISTKSRVETQINIVMTLENPPPGTEQLHLPLHTIAKSKLLAKEDFDRSKILELHTMLVCTSAMHNPGFKEKALKRAAAQNNDDIQRRAEQQRTSADEEKNDPKNVSEEDKPANGGEVKICNNCIQRERKRAGRKKLKREEEQQHWERYETERVIVFNSNEYLPFKSFEQTQQPPRDGGMGVEEPYNPPEGAMSVQAAMRIACYCRHQSEKEGFQVIFTMKDQRGNVVAQEISDSILITDDHKTHPPQLTTMTSDLLYHPSQVGHNGLPTSYSMIDLSTHSQPFTSSRSTSNLQDLRLQAQLNPHSHIHQLPNNGFASQATSATMTPNSLSRPASPTSAGQSGPNKKRKSSGPHRRLPSGLQMTQARPDTNQPQTAPAYSTRPMSANFSPEGTAFPQQNDQPFMTIPNSGGAAQFYGSGPPTPAHDNAQFSFGHNHQLDITRAQNASAYFSHPSSTVPSRSNSPVFQQHSRNVSAYSRPIQTPTNQIGRGQGMFGGQASAGAMADDGDQSSLPTITKITPKQGPTAGGTEVSIFGYNFTHSTQIMFGESLAPTTFYGSQSILATSPPGRRGQVRVMIKPNQGQIQFAPSQSNNIIFTYQDTNPQMMEMALRFLSQQQTGDSGQWMQYTNQVANQFMQTSISPAGIQGPGYGGGNMLASDLPSTESGVLKVFDLVDASESPRQPCYDFVSEGGQTMLILATSLGYHQVAAALLARGANPDVRDNAGYTALMHATLHGRSKTFQLLLIRGADPTLRCLKGYAALDLVAPEDRETFLQILQNTRRSRRPRPSLHSQYSFGSHASSRASWDISSASFYESEIDTSEHAVSMPTSRRPSAHVGQIATAEQMPERSPSPASAAMLAWRAALTAQMTHFQQTVHSSVSNFQLPALPPLPDYHDSAMVRRLSCLVPSRYSTRPSADGTCVGEAGQPNPSMRFWDMFSYSPSSPPTPPPPAYSELFPEKTQPGGDQSNKRSPVQTAAVEAVMDEKCAMIFDQTSTVAGSSSTGVSQRAERPKKAECAKTVAPWLWMPLLVIVTSMCMHAAMPYILMVAASVNLPNCSAELLGRVN